MSQPLFVAVLFAPPSPQWGLRGDPYLWQALAERGAQEPWPRSEQALVAWVAEGVRSLTGHELSEDSPFFVEPFSHGGMSSGFVAPAHWREVIVPFLCSRFRETNADENL